MGEEIYYVPCFACAMDRHDLCVPEMTGPANRPRRFQWTMRCGCECRKEAA